VWETNLQVQNRETTPVQGVIAVADIPVGFRTLDEEVSKKYFKGTVACMGCFFSVPFRAL
jgi:hypothetical protein